MSVKYEDIMTRCPYYLRSSKYSIGCEGVVEGTEALTKFDDLDKKSVFQEKECFRYPNDCPIAKEHDRRMQ